jgi:molecular chaperone HscA
MDTRDAQLLLKSLLDRVEVDPETGKKKLVGNISESEWEALQEALKSLGGQTQGGSTVEEIKSAEEGKPKAKYVSISKLDMTALKETEPKDSDVILCLDFGTATSKAFAAECDGEFLKGYLELGLGARTGEVNLTYPVTSSLWIDENSRIYFGKEAFFRSLQAKEGRQRLDSLKQALSQGLKDPDEVPLDEATNPTGTRLCEGHVLVLYLSYLTDLAVSELAERYHKSRYVGRRFALPYWDEERRVWGEKILRKYLAMAQIIGDTFHDKWGEGIDIEMAKNTIEKVKSLEKLPYYLLKEGVSEPIAAGGSRLRANDVGFRNLAAVVDVGAGTTDFGAFVVVSQSEDKPPKVWPIAKCVRTVRQGGNTVDECLRSEILKRHGIDSGHSDYKRINAHLQLRIRELKESLFREGTVRYILQNEATGTVDLDSFLGNPNVEAFSNTLHLTFKELVESIPKSFIERLGEAGLTVVLTGGGASMPMVQRFGEEPVYVHRVQMKCQKADLVPEGIRLDYPLLVSEYPQLAVAMGGAAPTLPRELESLDKMPGLSKRTVELGGFYTKGQ